MVGLFPALLDTISQPVVNLWGMVFLMAGTLGISCTVGTYLAFTSPDIGAAVFLFMRERCGLPAFISYPLALLPFALIWIIGMMGLFVFVPAPAKIMDPSWHAADDGLDEVTRVQAHEFHRNLFSHRCQV